MAGALFPSELGAAMRRDVVTALWIAAWSPCALAALEGPGRDQFIQAVRAADQIQVDGVLDEAAWADAKVFDGFVQRYPAAGTRPSERTELRVLYDDRNLYVAITCYDSEPEKINRRLGRRDSDPPSDAVQLFIDPSHGHRTAYVFYLNAGGVQGDGLFYDDSNFTHDWDGVWDAAAGSFPGGWIAEYSIPLALLRFPGAEIQTWGFGARRDIARKNEELDSVANPRSSNATVSRLGHLTGMQGLRARREVGATGYVAARTQLRPQYSSLPDPRLFDPSADVGLDLVASVTSDLTLNATVNPDFAQVEADKLILNLSNVETFFPEKRPFFTEGMELFQESGSENGPTPQQIFYSRRIGLEAPILAAAKLTGSAASGVEVGVLDAWVMGPGLGAPADEANPDRRFSLHLERPLHLGSNIELPAMAPTPTNFLTAVARTRLGRSSSVGAAFASAVPVSALCTDAQGSLADGLRPSSCDTLGGNAAAVKFDLKSADSAFGLRGQLTGSQVVGGPPERVLRDGTALRRGDFGYGGYLRAGKIGGDGFRWDLGYDFASPTLELNPTGFLQRQNDQRGQLTLRYDRPEGFGPFKASQTYLTVASHLSADGRYVHTGTSASLNSYVVLPSFDAIGFETGTDFDDHDVREVGSTGIPMERPGSAYLALFVETSSNRPLAANVVLALGTLLLDPAPSKEWYLGRLRLSWRPIDALESGVEFEAESNPQGPRYVNDLGGDRYLFGDLRANHLSLTVRQSVIFTPKLSLQGYAQLFTASGVFGNYFEGASDAARSPISLAGLVPSAYSGNDDFYESQLNLNLVLRWEYRLGSTLYLVYTRSSRSPDLASGETAPRTLLPVNVLAGPSADAVLVKWTYFFGA